MKYRKYIQGGFFLLFVCFTLFSAQSQSRENSDFLYAKRLYDDGMLELAAKQFRAFMENYPTNPRAPEALFMAGEAYYQANLFENARQAFLEVTVRFPRAAKNDEAQFRIGDCYQAQKKYFEAAQAFHRVKVFYPKSPLAPTGLMEAGRMFARAGDYSQSLKMYFSFQDEFPEDPQFLQVRLEIVTVLLEKGELQRALKEADKLILFVHKGKIQFQTMYQKGRALEEMGRVDDAQLEYLALLKNKINNDLQAKVHLRLGFIYRLKGEWAQSNKYFLNALKARGEKATRMETFLILGDNYYDLQNFATAQENYLKAVNQASKTEYHYFEGLHKTALTHEALADYKNAIQFHLRLLKEYTPINRLSADFREQSYLRVAQSHLALGDGRSAISYFRQYLEQYPESELKDQLIFKIAQIYEQYLMNPDKALQMYGRFIELFPQSIYVDEAQLGIARAHEAIGNYTKAIKAYHNFLQAYPGGKHYFKIAQRIERLKTYHLKNLEKGVSVLSQLVGSQIANQSTTNNLLALAQLNYEQLRDYRQASTYYRRALKLGAGGIPQDELYYRIAQCYQRLAYASASVEIEATQPALIDSARRIFQLVRNEYQDANWADDAALALVAMPEKGRTAPSGTAADYNLILRQFPLSPRKDFVLFKLGEMITADRLGVGTDSLQTASYYFDQLLSQFPASKYACAAQFQKGLYLSKTGELYGARQALEHYLQRCNQDGFRVQADYVLAEIMRLQQNFEQSAARYEKIITNYFYSDYADSAKLKLADVLLEKGDYQAALDHLLAVQHQFAKFSWSGFDKKRAELFARDEFEYKIAVTYKNLHDLTNAKLHYQNYLKIAPNGPYVARVLLALGKITSAAGAQDTEIALSYFGRLKSETSDNQINYSAAVQSADLLFHEKKYPAAQVEYKRSIQFASIDSEKEYPLAQLIICNYRLGEIQAADNAVDGFEKQFGNIPDFMAQFQYEKGEHYLGKKFFERAEKIYSTLRKKYKHTGFAPKAELALSRLYFQTNKDEKALDIITQIPEKYPESEVTPIAYINLGDYYLKEAKIPENSVSLYKKALEHPKLGKLRNYASQNLIDAYQMMGMHDQVLALVREQLRNNPNEEVAFRLKLKIAMTYKALRQYDLAVAQFEELKKTGRSESEAEVQFYLGECYNLMGQYEKAITEYLKVKYIAKQVKGLPWDVSAQYKAAQAYIKIKHYDEAKRLLNKIIRTWGAQSDFGRAAVAQIEQIDQLLKEPK